jgi:hypothetical protein
MDYGLVLPVWEAGVHKMRHGRYEWGKGPWLCARRKVVFQSRVDKAFVKGWPKSEVRKECKPLVGLLHELECGTGAPG